jgi:hypothetical protein
MTTTRRRKGATAPTAGEKLTASVLAVWDLDEHELLQLAQAAKLADRLAALDAIVDDQGVMVAGTADTAARVHPALIESRQSRIALARLLAALRLPTDSHGTGRAQRRTGVRGPYNVGGVA